jgi:Di-haem oxidoreductase, putative peroxidase
MTKKTLLGAGLAALLLTLSAWAQEGPALTAVDGLTQADIEAYGLNPPDDVLDFLRTLGLVVFTTPFNTFDGLGDGPFDGGDPTQFGHRPTLQGNGIFLRLNGLDSQSCNECHSLVSHSTIPPILGIGGAGTVAQSAFPVVSMVDVADTFDNRVQYFPGHDPDLLLAFDGEADFNGRFINAPFLFGGGGVELLAKEMTANLLAIYKEARSDNGVGVIYELATHGTSFGFAVSTGPGTADLTLEGIGLNDPSLTPEQQLVVRPFGRKGDAFSMRDFDRGAMQFHFGMQPTETIDPAGNPDPDGDNVVDEVTIAEMTVLHIFAVTNPPPFGEPLDFQERFGFRIFKDIGCASCHRTDMRTKSTLLPLAFKENETNPWENVYLNIDLTQFGFAPDPHGTGVIVPLFSDLKRHDMGDGPQGLPRLKEDCEDAQRCRVANEEFITARLWGIADTGPYLHDGRATTLRQAIEAHAGEALAAEQNFENLSDLDQTRLISFLRTLRTPIDPNQDILP